MKTFREKIVLASTSPRRYEILKRHGIDALVVPSDEDETLPPEIEKLPPPEIVSYLAHIKARAVYEMLTETRRIQNRKLAMNAEHAQMTDAAVPAAARTQVTGVAISDAERSLILAADTIVFKAEIIGKPKDEADAFRILSLLRDAEHSVYTGVALINLASGEETRLVDETKVRFKDYSDAEIYRFIREEAPYDKSGSYAIQSSWSRNIASVDGDIENVMGLPWYRIAELLSCIR